MDGKRIQGWLEIHIETDTNAGFILESKDNMGPDRRAEISAFIRVR